MSELRSDLGHEPGDSRINRRGSSEDQDSLHEARTSGKATDYTDIEVKG